MYLINSSGRYRWPQNSTALVADCRIACKSATQRLVRAMVTPKETHPDAEAREILLEGGGVLGGLDSESVFLAESAERRDAVGDGVVAIASGPGEDADPRLHAWRTS
jgi:hypothetical protein